MGAQVFFFFFRGVRRDLGGKNMGLINEIIKLSTRLKLESPWNITTYHERMEIHNKFCHGKSAVSGIRTGWRRLERNWRMVASIETCWQSKMNERIYEFMYWKLEQRILARTEARIHVKSLSRENSTCTVKSLSCQIKGEQGTLAFFFPISFSFEMISLPLSNHYLGAC